MAEFSIKNLKNQGQDGAIFSSGFENIVENGAYKLKMRSYASKQTDSSSTTNLNVLTGLVKRDEISSGSYRYLYGIAGQRIWKISEQDISMTNPHTTTQTGSNFADVWVDDNNNLWWTSSRYIGKYDGTTWTDNSLDLGASYDSASTKRQFITYDDQVFICNGDYIAKIDNDGTNFNASYKQLPQKYEVACGASNGNLVLFGAERWGKGILLLWNTTDTNWTNKLYFDKAISAIQPYKNGWIFSAGTGFYYTNGYSIEALGFLPETSAMNGFGLKPYAMEIVDDNIIFAGIISSTANLKAGFMIFNVKDKTFSLIPNHNNDFTTSNYGKIFKNTTGAGTPQILTSYGYDDGTSKYAFSKLLLNSVNYSGTGFYFSKKISFDKKISVSSVRLKISIDKKDYLDYSGKTADITVACSDGRDKFWSYLNTNALLTDPLTIQYDGTASGYNNVSVGDLILSLDGSNAGESAFVSSIANSGTTTETLTLDTAFSNNTENTRILNVIPFRKFAKKTVTDTQEVEFFNNEALGLVDELYVFIKVETTNFPLNIDDVVITTK